MSKKAELHPEKIHLIDFKIIKGQIESPFNFDQEKIISHPFQVSFELGFSLENKLIKTTFSIELLTESEPEQEEAKGYFEFVYVFEVENLSELAKLNHKDDEEVEVDGNLGAALASIVYSTSRGILMTRFQGTVLQEFILPVIDPTKLLE